jgi:hypothetical protein
LRHDWLSSLSRRCAIVVTLIAGLSGFEVSVASTSGLTTEPPH